MHTSIKKYKNIQAENTAISFDIKRMEELYEKFGGQHDDVHRHDYYTILIVRNAKGKHIIDFNAFDLAPRQVYFISPNQVHQMLEEEKPKGFVLTFSQQFLMKNGIEQCFIDDLHLFNDFGFAPPLGLEIEEQARLIQICEQMESFIHSDKKFKNQAIGALLKLFLVHCNNACALSNEENTQTVQAAVVLLRNFKELLNQHFKQWHKVGEYSKALHITSDYLNASVKSLTGKSAKEHIQSRILIAAKRLLLFSELSTKEIAYELGFSEPANFSQFFKRCTGVSPSKFQM